MITNSKKQEITLVLGGTGKTGRRVADQLEQLGLPVRRASMSAVRSKMTTNVIDCWRLPMRPWPHPKTA